MKKKLVALTLVAAMALTATGCGDSSNQASNAGSSTSTTEAGAEKEYTTVKVSTVTFNNLSSETESVENAINTYIRENTDVPVQIDLDFYDAASYQQQYQMRSVREKKWICSGFWDLVIVFQKDTYSQLQTRYWNCARMQLLRSVKKIWHRQPMTEKSMQCR